VGLTAVHHGNPRKRNFVQKENDKLRGRQVRNKNLPTKFPTLVNGSTSTRVNTTRTCHNLECNAQTNVDHKIVILGGSHARGLSSNVSNNLDDNYSVCGLVKPGADTATLIPSRRPMERRWKASVYILKTNL